MPGTFIVSLDCEGMWGMADQPREERSHATREGLRTIYAELLDLFKEFEVPTTFAFVGMFVLTPEEREHFEPMLGSLHYRGSDWLTKFKEERDCSQLDGWFCPESLDMVKEHPMHEVGSHGFTHIPFDGPDTPDEVYSQEFRFIEELGKMKDVNFRTLIFPRNRLGHLDKLSAAGIEGYRELLEQKGGAGGRLLREFYVAEKSQAKGSASGPLVKIPAGYFLNWRAGARRHVPQAITRMRWCSILDDAARTNGVAHVWSHPHNFLSAPSTMDSFRFILQKAADLRDQGKLIVQTQAQYTQAIRSEHLSPK